MPSWNTPERLRALLCQLVSWESGTGSFGEARFPFRLAELLRAMPAFAARPELVAPGASDERATYVTALHRCKGSARTVVLLSHFDTVDTVEYGLLRDLAHDPEALTAAMHEQADTFEPHVAADIRSGEYLFGRGTADMKAGLALHVALLERAHAESWPVNLLLLSVADEENSSAGMRAAVDHLVRLREEHGLEYALFLNSEPSMSTHPDDEVQYAYSGTLGKLLPSAICLGRETHASTPLAGVTSTYVAGFLAREVEWSTDFDERVHGERTPLPVTLWQRDLRSGYSTQTTSRTSLLCNVFVMELSATEVLDRFTAVAQRAADTCSAAYAAVCAREGIDPLGAVRVLRYDELVEHATAHLGADTVAHVVTEALSARHDDLPAASIGVADALLVLCPELAPAIITMFAPPYYPPVSSAHEPLVQACIARVQQHAADHLDLQVEHAHWFTALCDLSYVDHRGDAAQGETYARSTPGYGSTYEVPFAAMAQLRAPVLNLGPRGRDLHMRTERLHVASAFAQLPELLAQVVAVVGEFEQAG